MYRKLIAQENDELSWISYLMPDLRPSTLKQLSRQLNDLDLFTLTWTMKKKVQKILKGKKSLNLTL